MSQENLAGILLVSRQTVSLWETGQTLPTVDNLIRLCEIFGVSLDALLGMENTSDSAVTETETLPEEHAQNPSESICRYTAGADEKKRSPRADLKLCAAVIFIGIALMAASVIYAVLEPFLSFFDGILVASLMLIGASAAFFACGRVIRIKKPQKKNAPRQTEVSDGSKKRKFPFSKIAVISVLTLAAAGVCVLVAVNYFGTLATAERIADIDIPEYIGKNERKLNFKTDSLTPVYETEIYFTDKYAEVFEADIPSDKWQTAKSLSAEISAAFSEYADFTADYYIICSLNEKTVTGTLEASGEYMALCYLADENMLRIIEFKVNK